MTKQKKIFELKINNEEKYVDDNYKKKLEFIEAYETYKIYKYDDIFYALTHDQVDKTESNQEIIPILLQRDVIKNPKLDAVKHSIKSLIDWANSRGNIYQDGDVSIKANSLVGIKKKEYLIDETCKIVKYNGKFIAINHSTNSKYTDEEINLLNSKQPIIKNQLFHKYKLLSFIFNFIPRKTQLNLKKLTRNSLLPTDSKSTNIKKLVKILLVSGKNYFLSFFKKKHNEVNYNIIGLVNKESTPELLWSEGEHNFVKFGEKFYAIPFGLQTDWSDGSLDHHNEVLHDFSLKNLYDKFLEKTKIPSFFSKVNIEINNDLNLKSSAAYDSTSTKPLFIKSVNNYKIFTYEGWYYGVPDSYTEEDLESTDLILSSEIFRDVSEEVVSDLILEKFSAK